MNCMNNMSREKGATTIFMAVVLVGIIGIAAFAVDIGYGLVVKTQLQNVADTGTLAGTRELALIYQQQDGWSTTDSYKYHYLTDTEQARVAAKVNSFSQLNKAGGVAITIRTNDDIIWGKFNKENGELEPTTPARTGVTGIKVTARRDQNVNGVLATGLGRVLGINSLSVAASSASTLSSLRKVPSGKLGIPVGISKFWFTARNSPCGKHDTAGHGIRLYPTGPQTGETITNSQSCAGWHTYTEQPASAAKLKSILTDLKSGSYVSPPVEANVDSFQFTGGAVATAFNNMKLLYETSKNNQGTWTTIVPVYDAADCANPQGAIKIVGFATAYIYSVTTSPANTIDATIDCNIVDFGEGGGDDYGTLVGSPGMVQ
jgi:Flp pilus assembly protein TadG